MKNNKVKAAKKAKTANDLMRLHQLIAREMSKDYVILDEDTVLLMVKVRNTTTEAIEDPEMAALLEDAGLLDVCAEFIAKVDRFFGAIDLGRDDYHKRMN
jgi:hypothetical protein